MTTEQEQLELNTAKAELAKALVDADISRLQLSNQQRQMNVQLVVALIGLVTAMATAYMTLRVSDKGESNHQATIQAVRVMSSNQAEQSRRVEDLRAFTLEVASAEPVVMIVGGDGGPPASSSRQVSRPAPPEQLRNRQPAPPAPEGF